jgi:osmotically-inducible protein OsmY
MNLKIRTSLLATALAASAFLGGCAAPVVMGGAMLGTVLVASDRRTSGIQLEDEGIELRANARVREMLDDKGNVNFTSYNRVVLLTGEVPTEADKQRVAEAVLRVENVRSISNEIQVMGNSTLTQRSSDALVTGRVKAAFVDARDLFASAFKVTTERGTTYLMGRVTQREATRATEIARNISGVQRVVRLFEIISEEELARMLPSEQKK